MQRGIRSVQDGGEGACQGEGTEWSMGDGKAPQGEREEEGGRGRSQRGGHWGMGKGMALRTLTPKNRSQRRAQKKRIRQSWFGTTRSCENEDSSWPNKVG